MKMISSINDIIEINSDFPYEFMEHLKEEFMLLFEALGDGEKLFSFALPKEFAFYVFQEGDVVSSICTNPFDLEFVERFHVKQVIFYRIGVRLNGEVAVYYLLKGLHNPEEEDGLEEHAERGNG